MKMKYISAQALLVLLCLLLHACGGDHKAGVAVMDVKKGTFDITIPAVGELQAVTSTPISLPPYLRGSQTIAWMAPENSLVKKGEIVARLDGTTYKERIETEEFAIAKINLEIEKKEKELEKEKKDLLSEIDITGIEKKLAELYGAKDKQLYSANEIIDAAIDLGYLKAKDAHYLRQQDKLEKKSGAELQLLSLRRKTHSVKIGQYKQSLTAMDIKAPHDGLLIYQKNWRGDKPRVGQTIWGGRKLGKLPDLSSMEAKAFVLESEAAGLKEKLPVSIMLEAAPGKVFRGEITSIVSIAKPMEQQSPLKYFEVKVKIDNKDNYKMKPGSRLNAVIYVSKLENVITVPNQALFFHDEKVFVNVEDGSGFDEKVVEIGIRSLTKTVIKKGLEVGDRILLGKLSGANAGSGKGE